MLRARSIAVRSSQAALVACRTLTTQSVRASASGAPLARRFAVSTSKFEWNMGRRFLSEATEQTSEAKPEEAKPAAPVNNEKPVGEAQVHGFKAETRQLLDIVAKSLYHDKEVFVRELVSNASDALEKARYLTSTNSKIQIADELAVSINVDPAQKLFIIQDNGVGMTKADLMDNLGTIAKSGSRDFLKEFSGETQSDVAKNIIGKFGVGFYSAFMVADKVTVYSKKRGEDLGHCWMSTGDGSYEISAAEGVEFGTKIILHLRDDCSDFASEQRVKSAVTKYSSFVSFPVKCNGEKVNEVKALWLKDASSITAEEHGALYRHVSNAYDEPQFHLVYKADAPIDIKSVFYIPSMNVEMMGLGKAEPGVHLYSRRVLIQANSKELLPEWLRFVKGVVDSEDLPLSISRENMQDLALLAKLKAVLSKRVVRWLIDEAKKDPVKYMEFYRNYSLAIKEGVAVDRGQGAEIAKLLRYATSLHDDDKNISLQEYVEHMKEGQDTIYYIVASNRRVALSSPYYEAFKRGGYEVLLCYNDHDEVVLGNLGRFADKQLRSIETVEPPAAKEGEAKEGEAKAEEGKAALSADQEKALVDWLKTALGPRVTGVEATQRLVDSPAIIADHDSAATRKILQMSEFRALGINRPQGYKLQVNLRHPLLVSLDAARLERPDLAALVAHQLLDNAVLAAGIMDGARDMVPRLAQLMHAALRPSEPVAAPAEAAPAAPAAEAPK